MTMSTEVYFRIPYPPLSGNHMYSKGRGGSLTLRDEILEYRNQINGIMVGHGLANLMLGKGGEQFWLEWQIHPPGRGRRDVDNFRKPVADAISRAGVWSDDSNLVLPVEMFRWYPATSPGHVSVWIRSYEGEDEEEEMQAAAEAAAVG